MKTVASFAEAWIEKDGIYLSLYVLFVASFAEAWIENFNILSSEAFTASPPSRRRGLKKKDELPLDHPNGVASFAEAWIEKKLCKDTQKMDK